MTNMKSRDALGIRNNYLYAGSRRGEKQNVIMAILLDYGARKEISYRRMKSCFRFQASNADEGMHLGIIRRYNLGGRVKS